MELYTRRSIPECLGEAWTLLSTNLRRITKSLWLPILLFALTAGITAPLMFIAEKHFAMGVTTSSDIVYVLMTLACYLAIIAATIYFSAKIFKLLNEQTTKFCVKRQLMNILIEIFFACVFCLIGGLIAAGLIYAIKTGTVAPKIGLGLSALASFIFVIIVFLCACPLCYSQTKYMIEPEMRLRQYWKAYKVGWKNIGKIVGLVLLCALIFFIAQTLISMPGTIAMFAARFSLEGVANGDPDGLPSSFPYILGVTALISSLVTAVLIIWTTFSGYYLYASIEAKQRSLS